jgi:hypothetical protein
MDLLTRNDLQKLAETPKELCVSIYMPTYRAGRETEQNAIRFKNLLEKARTELSASGLDPLALQELLKPAEDLLPNGPFWQHQSHGLATFIASDTFHHYRLPLDFEELVMVGNRFHLKPLFPFFDANERFYILALSQSEVRLFQGTAHTVGEIDLADAPEGLANALRFDDPERQLQYHTSTRTPGGMGDRPATYHGQGVSEDNQKTDLLRYFRKVDQGVHPLLRGERAPLVLAGVEYLLPIYREANTYPHLADQGILGNPETLSDAELYRQAIEIVRPLFHAEQRKARDRYQALVGAGDERASSAPASIVSAAHYGRVDTLFVALGCHLWGTFDANSMTLEVHQAQQADDVDLLDLAAEQTILQGGTVYASQPPKTPGNTCAAALFRY